MEHQTLTAQSTFASEFLNSHELAHSWWGNMITCATWHDIWLNEGFATYGEALWQEFKGGTSNKAALRAYMATRRPRAVSGTVYRYDISTPGRIFSSNYAYAKGAWVLHQLRGVVGDTAFFKILADYRAAKAYQSATTAEFAAIASRSYGRDLSWFFDECVMKGGAPSYRYGWAHRVVGNRNYLFLHAEQTQYTKGYTLFRFPIEIRVDGTSFRVTHDGWRDEWVLPLSRPPTRVLFDPDRWILWESVSRGVYAPSLTASATTLGATTGGTVVFTLRAGAKFAGRGYVMGGSLTGIHPGIQLPGTPGPKTLPLVFDPFTQLVLYNLNGPAFQNFAGFLDSGGTAQARLVLPPLGAAAVGTEAHFAWLTVDAPYFTSLPVTVKVVR